MPVLASSADRRSHKISAAAHGSPVLILIMMCGRGVVGNFKVEAPCEGTYLPRASFEGRTTRPSAIGLAVTCPRMPSHYK